jgi:hypothetical protein
MAASGRIQLADVDESTRRMVEDSNLEPVS